MFNTSIEHPTFSGSWDYSELPDNGKPGPTDWVSIIPESVTGNFQSPIDIPLDAPIADFTNVIDLHYNEAVPHELFNNGHTIELEFAEGSNLLTLAGHDFELLQFHFHTPSEHTVAGEAFPMAMHLVHASAEGGLTVLGVLFEEGPVDNSNFAPFFEEIAAGHLDNKDDHVEGAELGLINPLNLLPSGSLTGYSYRGSLTTPPATEQVNWFVFNEPIQLSKAQIDAYKAAADDVIQENDFNPGARPVQPLTGRTFNDLVILRDLTVPLQVINFRDDLDMSPGDEFFTGDRPFPVFGRFGDFDHFGIHATGTLLVPADGLWTFGSSSSDGSILRIGGVDVIDDRDNHDARRVFGAIELSAGEHEFEYLMYEQTGAASAELAVALESGDFTDGSGSYVLLSVPECGDCDSDGDGLLDSVELASGTNPANADDALQILVGVLNEETFEVTWNSIPGRAYEVQGSTSLARDSWTTLATVTSDSDSTSAEVGIPWLSRTPMGFFRVRLLEQ
jgi:carbonic anhydrase